jgi:hypothetical protein
MALDFLTVGNSLALLGAGSRNVSKIGESFSHLVITGRQLLLSLVL